MKFLYFIIAMIAVFIGFAIRDHYFDGKNKRKIVREPFFMPENIKRYYKACEDILSPYLAMEPCRIILEGAEEELKQNYRQYKHIIKDNWDRKTYKYYIDVCENNGYEYYIYRNWAILYIRLRVEYIHYQRCEYDPQAFQNFREYIDNWHKKIVSKESDCPDSFIEHFSF